MNHARQESCQRDTEGLTKGLGQGTGNTVVRDIDLLSSFKRSGQIDPIAGEGIGNNALSGDILVDVDAGSLGTGLVIWIMGG